MENLFILLNFICLIATVIGLINPSRVFLGKDKTRIGVLKIYGIGTWISFGIAMSENGSVTFLEGCAISAFMSFLVAFIICCFKPQWVTFWENKSKQDMLHNYFVCMCLAIVVILASSKELPFLSTFCMFALIGCLVAFIRGLIDPSAVIKWGPKHRRTRKGVMAYYGVGMIALMTIGVNANTTQVTEPIPVVENIKENQVNNIVINDQTQEMSKPQAEAIIAEEEVASHNEQQETPSDVKSEVTIVPVVSGTSNTEQASPSKEGQEATTTTKPESNSTAKPEPKPETSSTAKPEPKPETSSTTKPEPKPETSSTAKPESKPVASTKPAPIPSTNVTPDTGNANTVYWTPSGKVYHSTKGCPSLSKSKTILSGSISDSGKPRRCERC